MKLRNKINVGNGEKKSNVKRNDEVYFLEILFSIKNSYFILGSNNKYLLNNLITCSILFLIDADKIFSHTHFVLSSSIFFYLNNSGINRLRSPRYSIVRDDQHVLVQINSLFCNWSLRKSSYCITYESTSLTNGKKKKAGFKKNNKEKTIHVHRKCNLIGSLDQNCSTDISNLRT